MTKKDDRIQTVTSLRDAAIRVVHKKGKWEKFGETRVMKVKNHLGLSIIYKTPFQTGWKADRLRRDGYFLQIMRCDDVILAIYWDRDAPLTVETFTSGLWEKKLCPLVTRQSRTNSRCAAA